MTKRHPQPNTTSIAVMLAYLGMLASVGIVVTVLHNV